MEVLIDTVEILTRETILRGAGLKKFANPKEVWRQSGLDFLKKSCVGSLRG